MDSEKQQNQVGMEDFLVLGHLIKYNFYMLAKSICFASILRETNGDIPAAVEEANSVMEALDLDTKRRREFAEPQEPDVRAAVEATVDDA